MVVTHAVDGDVDLEAVRRAIELSATKYCTVTANLSSGVVEIRHRCLVRDTAGHEHAGDVLVTGPNEQPDELGSRASLAAV